MSDYEKGWDDAFDAIAKYVEAEICIVTAQMIKRMKEEKWRFPKAEEAEVTDDRLV